MLEASMWRFAVVLLVSCGSPDRAPAPSGEHPAGTRAPVIIGVGGGSSTTATRKRIGYVRSIPSLMRAPRFGETAFGDVTVNGIPLRDGQFEVASTGWMNITDGMTRVLASVAEVGGELTLPIVARDARGVPGPDRATVVLQLTDAVGTPILGAVGESKPGVVGPCYDKSSDEMFDAMPSTGTRGAIAYLQIDPAAGPTFRVELMAAGKPIVAEVPIVAGTITFLRAPID